MFKKKKTLKNDIAAEKTEIYEEITEVLNPEFSAVTPPTAAEGTQATNLDPLSEILSSSEENKNENEEEEEKEGECASRYTDFIAGKDSGNSVTCRERESGENCKNKGEEYKTEVFKETNASKNWNSAELITLEMNDSANTAENMKNTAVPNSGFECGDEFSYKKKEGASSLHETEFFDENASPATPSGKVSSKIPTVPPQEIPGYQFERYLGSGAYGEVWIAVQVSTMRRVAIKFYTHRLQNIDFLTQEVEKLSLLFSDQNTVQLLEVGWNAKTPYYIMEYLEKGSLADALDRQKGFSQNEAEEMFETILRAMCRAHQKGIIHCDLKPGNILLDQNGNPHLADFGQSRLSNDMAPALGTLFYMPPEQAQIHTHADVRWDIYALGAIFYTMLMRIPPHYSPEFVEQIQTQKNLSARLKTYRKLLENRRVPTDFRRLKGMTPPVAQILEKCLQPDPEKRFQTMDELWEAWRRSQNRRAQFPLLVLGMIMPIILLLVGGTFVSWEFQAVFQKSIDVLTDSSLVSEKFAAESVATNVEYEITRRRGILEQISQDWQFRDLVQEMTETTEWKTFITRLTDSSLTREQQMMARHEFVEFPHRQKIQSMLESLLPADFQMESGDDLVFCDANGIFSGRIPEADCLGHCSVSLLCGEITPVKELKNVTKTGFSSVFLDPVTNVWSVAIYTPVFSAEEDPVFLGILFMSVDIGNFINMEETDSHFAVLVDERPGKTQGLILEHPIYNQLIKKGTRIPDSFLSPEFRVTEKIIPDTNEKMRSYRDPLAKSPHAEGKYAERWLAASADVHLGFPDGGNWMIITQKSYDKTIGSIFSSLEAHFWHVYLFGAAAFVLIVPTLWYFIHRIFILKQK